MAKNKKVRTKKTEISKQAIIKIATVIILIGAGIAVGLTGKFVYKALENMSDNFVLSEVDREAIETINLEGLSELRKKIEEKNKLDEPRAGQLRNPFAEPVPETVPEPDPIPEPEPIEETGDDLISQDNEPNLEDSTDVINEEEE